MPRTSRRRSRRRSAARWRAGVAATRAAPRGRRQLVARRDRRLAGPQLSSAARDATRPRRAARRCVSRSPTPPTSERCRSRSRRTGRSSPSSRAPTGARALGCGRSTFTTARPLPGTEGAALPLLVARRLELIGFFADRQLKTRRRGGGNGPGDRPRAHGGRGGTWADDGTIVFQPDSMTAGAAARSSGVDGRSRGRDRGSLLGRFPHFLPDGASPALLRAQQRRPAARGSPAWTAPARGPLLEADGAARVLPRATCFFVRGTTLLAQPIRSCPLSPSRETRLPDRQWIDRQRLPIALVPVSASSAGPIVFSHRNSGWTAAVRLGRPRRPRDRQGRRSHPGTHSARALSPDGSLVAFHHRTVAGNADIWLLDTARGVTNPLMERPTTTFQPGLLTATAWPSRRARSLRTDDLRPAPTPSRHLHHPGVPDRQRLVFGRTITSSTTPALERPVGVDARPYRQADRLC